MTVRSPPPVVVRPPAPRTESAVLPDGTVSVTCVVQAHVPAGILTVTVELVIALNAVCTSDALQLAALIVCPMPGRALRRNIKENHFVVMVGRAPFPS